MYGDVNIDYANLLEQASSYAQRKLATQNAVPVDNTRTWIFAGAAGVAAIALLIIILRRD